ncbi:acetyl-CoA synthetase-like protein [Astrocystis sublimbata]|nr:acetyl-CoA synthetase-like protein [Astrocystis sublimbata]
MPRIEDGSSDGSGVPTSPHAQLNNQSDYWLKQLEGSKPAELFHDNDRPAAPPGLIGIREIAISSSTHHALRVFCKLNQTSPLSVLLAAIRATHFRLTGVEDATLGVVNANAKGPTTKIVSHKDIQCIRLKTQDDSFVGLVRHASSTLADAEANQDGLLDGPTASTQLQLDTPVKSHLFSTVFELHPQTEAERSSDNTARARLLSLGYDLEIHLHEDEGYSGHVVFSEDIYHPRTIDCMISILNKVLERGIDQPQTSISLLYLGEESFEFYASLPQAARTDYPRQANIVDVFRTQVEANPNTVAVKDATTQMTYAQLDEMSDRIARSLSLRGLPVETLVAVFARRSCESIVAFMGILKANMAYVPLDVDAPVTRIETILSSGHGCGLVLLGSGLEALAMQQGPEWVSIADSLQSPASTTGQLEAMPSADSLAYVIFTSGSTGTPKGVMVEHRCIVRLVKNTNWMTTEDAATNVAHMSNLAFDAATVEIYTALLNGGTLICLEKATVLDNQSLCRAFLQERIGAACFTPALLRYCLAESPDTISGLHLLMVGGDKLDVRDARQGFSLVQGKFYNGYGPTENTVFSTMHRIRADDSYVNGVPIGQPISNSGAYVIDAQLRPVPVGVMGELIVTGDGLARGYTDPRQTRERFIEVLIDGQPTRAYRTGDYVRYRPADNEMEFFGRIDFQIKIRGNRVELSEIEHLLLSHQSVGEAVALAYKRNGIDTSIVGFVTIPDSEDVVVDDQEYEDTQVESEQIEVWKDLFDTEKYVGIDMLEGGQIGRDFTKWTSMYDGEMIDNHAMNEWLDDTIRSILNGGPAGRVLEVGSGTGMILFNITRGLESYCGLDPAPSAVSFVRDAAARSPELAEKVRVMVGTALDVRKMRDLNSPELVIVNSVAQYFPTPKYFLKAIEDFARLSSTTRLYLGDIRSFAMYKQFQASKALHLLGDGLTKKEMWRRIPAAERVEEELLLDPGFFTSLPDLFPQLISHVEILPKRMVATNELSCYRYAAVIHLTPKPGEPVLQVHDVPSHAWMDFTTQHMDGEKLEDLLRSTNSPLIAISNIPFAKTINERLIIESLEDNNTDALGDREWLASMRDASKQIPSLAPIDLERLASKTGFHVEISWARQFLLHGGLDAVFHKSRTDEQRALFRFPTDHSGRPFRTLSTHPLRRRRIQTIERELQSEALSKLPLYMVPNLIYVLDTMPINANGKWDRRALEAIASDLMIKPMLSLQPGARKPTGPNEQRIQEAWASVLDLDPMHISAQHNFLELGGDSIQAMRLVGSLRRQGFSLTVAQILSTPLLGDLALKLQKSIESPMDEVRAFGLLPVGTDVRESCKQAASVCGVPIDAVLDILPCTPLQEGLVAMTHQRHGTYVVRHIFEMHSTVNEERFRKAWEQVIQDTPILRTRLADIPGLGIMQIVLTSDYNWRSGDNLDDYLNKDKREFMGMPNSLRHEGIIRGDKRIFALTIHHALHDGWVMRLVLDALHQAYRGEAAKATEPFERFIKYVLDSDGGKSAAEFWRMELEGVKSLPFPRLPSPLYQPNGDRVWTRRLEGVRWANKEFTAASAVRAALAVLLAAYNNSNDVVYGASVTGRQAPVAGIEDMVGPTLAAVPIRCSVDENAKLDEFLRQVQQHATDAGPFEQMGLQNIRRISPKVAIACDFQTLLVVQPESIMELGSSELFVQQLSSDSSSGPQMNSLNTYALMFEVALSSDGVRITMSHDTTVVDEAQAQTLLDQLGHILRQLSAIEDLATVKVSDLTRPGDADLHSIWSWNSQKPAIEDSTVHSLFRKAATERPDSPAVCAWDGNFTYRELDKHSTSLARHLTDLGVGPDIVVPLCFEKSKWASVAMLGVLKAGGAFTILDFTNETEENLAAIVDYINPSLMLTSQSKLASAMRLAQESTVCICDGSSCEEWQTFEASLPAIKPDNTLYVTFRAGSHGVEESIAFTHFSFTGTFNQQQDALAMSSASRILDPRVSSVETILYAFCSAACLCIPSDGDRTKSLSKVITDLAVNHARLTPTETASLAKNALDSLEVLEFVGEPVKASALSRIKPSTKCINVYTSPGSCGAVATTMLRAESIGGVYDVISNAWVLYPSDAARLALPGCIGELWLEGPSTGYAYGETAVSFEEDPQWLLQGGPEPHQSGRRGRLYNTGDLARYLPNGRLQLLSYNRNPVGASVREEYVDLAQVEDTAWKQIVSDGVDQQNLHVVADVTTLNNQTESGLVLYIILPSAADLTEEELWAAVGALVPGLRNSMATILTPQTAPVSYVPLKLLPVTPQGTPDKHALRELALLIPDIQLKRLSEIQIQSRTPATTQERKLRNLWAAVLGIDAVKIGAEDSFLQLGGDSVLAMRLVAQARRSGLSLKTIDVLSCPKLTDLAKRATPIAKRRAPEYIAPLSLISKSIDRKTARLQAALMCNIEEDRVQDIFPCTPLQEGLIAMTAQHEDEYVAKILFPLASSTDTERLREAWLKTVAAVQILRTRIIDLPGQGLVQVIVNEEGSCPQVSDELVSDASLGLGTRLCHASLTGSSGKLQFRLVIHHSLYDGWSLPLVLDFFNQLYKGSSPERLVPLQGFVRYIQGANFDDAAQYWKGQFEGSEAVVFPPLPSPNYQYRADSTIERVIDNLLWPSRDVTAASAVRTAWALIQSRYTDSQEAVFGGVVTGRQAPVNSIEKMAGPTMATVPVRVKINPRATVEELLKQVHIQAAEMIPFEQTGLQRIRQLSAEAEQCTRFQVLLGIQPASESVDVASDAVISEHSAEGQASGADEFGGFNSYALMLVCDLGQSSVKIRMSLDSNVIDLVQGQRMLGQFEYVLRQLLTPELSPTQIEEISAVSPSDLDAIWAWNAEAPRAIEASVLDRIAPMMHEKAKEIAISAWDGELSFEQLDTLSTRLAQHILSLPIGVGPGTVLVLHFEKSMWMAVAMLAALKTGAASVAFDATLPTERFSTIYDQVQPKLVLSSASSASKITSVNSDAHVISISQQHLEDLPQPTEYQSVQINPHDPLCIVFTSGSTGTPKGTVLTHTNFSSAMQAHASAYGIGTTCFRLYDFTSYSFDFSWSALLLALSYGVTLCVPSEAERKSDVIASIARFQADFVFLTPSLVTALDFSKQSTLRTLAVGGELFNMAGVPPLDKNIRLLSIYGPSECTVVTTGNELSSPNTYLGSLGRGYNTNTWVVDPSNPSKLVPIGCTGELWLEGPLVGQGYFQEPEKSAAVFVENPKWLLDAHTGRKGRSGTLYQTGDLVKYMSDGSLEFIGRRDGQVKIRGQRVEFGEIEYNLRQLLGTGETGPQLVVDYVTLQGMVKPTLTVFVVPHAAEGLSEKEIWASVDRMVTSGISERLAETLPSYMIPTAYIALSHLPIQATGKADRRQLRQLAASTSRIAGQNPSHEKGIAEPQNELERTLRSVWAQVLNVNEGSLSVEKEFNHLGGDSISAMQVVSRCRVQNVKLTVADILRSQTIRRLAQACVVGNPIPQDTINEGATIDEGTAWALSPIQKMFFAAHASGNNHFNQSFILKTRTPIPLGKLQGAFKHLAERHPMLRARFLAGDNGQWTQQIGPLDSGAILNEHLVDKRSDIAPLAQKAQRSLDIQAGKVFRVDIFEVQSRPEQVVLLTAHHLIIDLVSWRIIWFDLETLLTGAQLASPKLSFHQWCNIQQADAETSTSSIVPDTPPQHSYWGITPEDNTEGSIMTSTRHVEATISSLILGDSNLAFGTEPLDILLSVLSGAFKQVFEDRAEPAFFLEGHGREPIDGMDIDLSETVGWFTTFHPVQLTPIAGGDICELVRRTKDVRARMPGKGRPYFARRCYDRARTDPHPVGEDIEILVNYTGRFQQLESENGLFTRLDDGEGDIVLEETSPNTRRFGILGVTVEIIHDQLTVTLGFNTRIKHRDRLDRWLDTALADLRTTALRLAGMSPHPTLADYPLLDISYENLDRLLGELKEMEREKADVRDIYPCTALQEGILLSNQAGAATYVNYWIWSCQVTKGNMIMPVNPEKFEDSWNRALARHGMFSTIFMAHPETGRHLQVLLSPRKGGVEQINGPKDSPEEFLSALQTPEFSAKSPPFSVKICSGLDGQVACRFDVSHALIDAAAMAALLRDLAMAYDDQELLPAPQFKTVVTHISATPELERLQYWTQFLQGVAPCCVASGEGPAHQSEVDGYVTLSVNIGNPTMLHEYCKSRGITRATFLQVAWALVLCRLTGLDKPCFGYLASGRDLPIDGIDEMVAPLINMLIGKVDLTADLEAALDETSKRSIDHMAYQHASLAEIQHALGLGSQKLFNTALTVRDMYSQERQEIGLQLKDVAEGDPTEFDLLLSAGVDGPSTMVELICRQSTFGSQAATEVLDILENAIDFILSKCEPDTGASDSVGLRSEFFRHQVGVDEDAATAYWKTTLEGLDATMFPEFPSPLYSPRVDSVTPVGTLDAFTPDSVSASAFFRATWALLLSRYSGDGDVVFSATTSQKSTGSRVSVVPAHVLIDDDMTRAHFLQTIQDGLISSSTHERIGLHRIRQLGENAARCCRGRSLLHIRTPGDTIDADGALSEHLRSYGIVVECELQRTAGVLVRVHYCSALVDSKLAQRMLDQFLHMLPRMTAAGAANDLMGSLSIASPADIADIWHQNAQCPEYQELHVHDAFRRTASLSPLAPAVSAWDGELTYGQLDLASTRLANHMVKHHGVGPGHFIPLVFEKSMWTTVAMLAVMKAGAASVAVDITQPEERLSLIIQQTKSALILTSKSGELTMGRLCGVATVIALSWATLQDISQVSEQDYKLQMTPDQPLCVVYTSGSTGIPKGAILTHRNWSSALPHIAAACHIGRESRVFDFAAYSFDIAWANFLVALHTGSCLCIPSESDRQNNLVAALQQSKATFAFLTPSLAVTLDLRPLAGTFQTLALGGEAVRKQNVLPILELGIRVINWYGPAECCAMATFANLTKDSVEGTIGHGIATNTWVIQRGSDGRGQLCGIGEIGELCLEGPLVAAGYLNDAEKTAASFIRNPPWLLEGGPEPGQVGRSGCAYRTGDLVKLSIDGSLVYAGREDAQVKIRGQRVELGEIEHHLRRHIFVEYQVAADLVTPAGRPTPILVAYVSPLQGDTSTSEQLRGLIVSAMANINDRLSKVLPAYMCPTAYIPINRMPLTATNKIDRKRLRQLGASCKAEEIVFPGDVQAVRRAPRTATEKQLQKIWASLLNIDARSISADDSFFQLGGDSIAAMRLVVAARAERLVLRVSDVMQCPKLCKLAERLTTAPEAIQWTAPEAFSLLKLPNGREFVDQHIKPAIHLESPNISDVFPTSWSQRDFITGVSDAGPLYSPYILTELPPMLDEAHLYESCSELVQSFDILRTVFVHLKGELFQVVLADLTVSLEQISVDNWEGVLQAPTDQERGLERFLGRSPLRFVLLKDGEGRRKLAMRISHAQYDGISLPSIMSSLGDILNGSRPASLPSFSNYMKHVATRNPSSYPFWRALLQNSNMTAIQQNTQVAVATGHEKLLIVEGTLEAPTDLHSGNSTPASYFTACCAKLLSRMSRCVDVVFGRVVSGRSGLPAQLEDTTGPCTNTIPVRVTNAQDGKLDALSREIQQQFTDSVSHETVGLDEMLKHCVAWPGATREFGMITKYQNIDNEPTLDICGRRTPWHYHMPEEPVLLNDTLRITGVPVEQGVHVSVHVTSGKFDEDFLRGVLEGLGEILRGN